MAKKADAWKEYKEAAILDMMLDAMPKVRMTFNLFVTSKNETTNSSIHQFTNLKCCIKPPFLIYYFKRHFKPCFFILLEEDIFGAVPKLYIPSTLNIDLILWHTQLIVCAVKC